MTKFFAKKWFAVASAAIGLFASFAHAQLQQSQLQPGDLLAMCGDSITQHKRYTEIVETYLLACGKTPHVQSFQFGWAGETSLGLKMRMQNDVLRFKPTIATLLYGMNDGGYAALTDLNAARYRTAQTAIVEGFKKAGVRVFVLASPTCVDVDTYPPHNGQGADVYNKTLTALGEIDKDIAAKEGVTFADVNTLMNDMMAKTKEKYGHKYVFAGPEGIHPGLNGHLVISYALLKALGCDGDIGTITIDLNAGKATASSGHEVLSYASGTAKIRSSRYPFCFDSNDKSPTSELTVLPFLPFMDDLNRFMLVVPGASGTYAVKFGDQTKNFDGADLSKGVNLASEFLANPFSDAFAKVQTAVSAQQEFETPMIKQFINSIPDLVKGMPENQAPFDQLVANYMARRQKFCDAAAAAVTPVEYEISVTPVK